jgi:hypothetical protein
MFRKAVAKARLRYDLHFAALLSQDCLLETPNILHERFDTVELALNSFKPARLIIKKTISYIGDCFYSRNRSHK